MADHIWYLEAVVDPECSRAYVPLNDPNLTQQENRHARLAILNRVRKGEVIAPDELPGTLIHDVTGPDTNLDIPLFHSAFIQIRQDMAAVLRRFDLGQTTLSPLRIELADGTGVDERYMIMLTANARPTIDPDASRALPYGARRRPALRSDGAEVHPSVRALRSAQHGPDLWTDPEVSTTVFVSCDLGHALRAEDFGRHLQLRKVQFSG